MRLTAAAASILAIGLVAAACGGDDATPEPADEAPPAPAATEAAEEPAEEPTEAPAEEAEEAAEEEPAADPAEEAEGSAEEPADEAEEATAEPEFAKKAAISNEDDPATTFGLTSGRYRMQWQTTGCEQVDILVTQTDGDFTFPWPSKSSFASATINDLPEGTYTIEQVDPACEEWNVRVDWMTN